jgi:lipoprotein-anchoring transpeptidase ErfK/SrfK
MWVFVNGVFSHGAWFWKNSTTAIFRTAGFWPGHARIQVRLTLRGVELSSTSSHRFVGASSTTRVHAISTPRSFIAYVNGISDRMTVKIDGTTVKVFKVSLGRKGDETRSGIKAVMEKYVLRHMTSVAAGITDPRDQYDLQVPWAVRITPTGEFVHGAPWANKRIGVYNGSHGCTNLFVADSHWFFSTVIPGDAVVTTGTNRSMEYWNGTGAPYNMPWTQWLAGSALKGHA